MAGFPGPTRRYMRPGTRAVDGTKSKRPSLLISSLFTHLTGIFSSSILSLSVRQLQSVPFILRCAPTVYRHERAPRFLSQDHGNRKKCSVYIADDESRNVTPIRTAGRLDLSARPCSFHLVRLCARVLKKRQATLPRERLTTEQHEHDVAVVVFSELEINRALFCSSALGNRR